MNLIHSPSIKTLLVVEVSLFASEDVVAVKVDGGEYIARAAFLETTSATGNTKAFFEFVIAFNRIKNLELSSLEMGGYFS